MKCEGNDNTFTFDVRCQVEFDGLITGGTILISTKPQNGQKDLMQLSEVLVLSNNVIDKLAIKFTLQQKFSLKD